LQDGVEAEASCTDICTQAYYTVTKQIKKDRRIKNAHFKQK